MSGNCSVRQLSTGSEQIMGVRKYRRQLRTRQLPAHVGPVVALAVNDHVIATAGEDQVQIDMQGGIKYLMPIAPDTARRIL